MLTDIQLQRILRLSCGYFGKTITSAVRTIPTQFWQNSGKLPVTFRLINELWWSLDRQWVFQEIEAPRFHDNKHMKVVRLSALNTGRLQPPPTQKMFLVFISVDPKAIVRAGRITQMKYSSYTNGIWTRDLPTCSAVRQPIAPPRAPDKWVKGKGKAVPLQARGTQRVPGS